MTNGKMPPGWPETLLGSFVLVSRPQPPGGFGEESSLVSPTEILSREHALVGRLMIALEGLVARLIDDPGTDVFPLNHAAITIKEFGAVHHMADEEQFLFPKFRDAGVQERLIDTLEVQHDRAREMIDRLITLTRAGRIDDLGRRNETIGLCLGFVTMYRAHAAWEETVLFPAFGDVATENYLDNIGMRMRDEERTLLGDPGLGKLLENLHRIEAAAGTSELASFTPSYNPP